EVLWPGAAVAARTGEGARLSTNRAWPRFSDAIGSPLLEKDIAEVGPVNLVVTHGAGLILRRLIVCGPGWSAGRQRGRESVALQAEHVDGHHFEEPGIGGTVGCVTSAAAFGLHRHMLVDEGSLLIDVALVADEIAAGQRPQLKDSSGPMRVVAVVALHQTLVDPVVIGFGKICLGRGVACVAQLGLALDQQVLFVLSVMGIVAVETSDIAAGVGGFSEMGLFMSFAVAA